MYRLASLDQWIPPRRHGHSCGDSWNHITGTQISRRPSGFRFGAGRGEVLVQLRNGAMTLTELAEANSVDAPYATLIVDKLEAQAWWNVNYTPMTDGESSSR